MSQFSTLALYILGDKRKSGGLFTGGKGTKKEKGKTHWNKEGIKYFKRADAKYRELYKNKKLMDTVYYDWENWLMLHQNIMIAGESSRKTFHSIMGTWLIKDDDNNSKYVGKKGDLKDDSESEDVCEDDGGYHSDNNDRVKCSWAQASTEEREMGVEKVAISGGREAGKTSTESPARNTRGRKGKK
jgi:hypothetical protein